MTPKNDLEIRGNFLTHPFAEVIAEVAQARLSGSLRVEAQTNKSVVYFRDGRIVFAASNARTSRLYDMLLARGKLSKAGLTKLPNFANDFELVAALEDKGVINETEIAQIFSEQVMAILVDALSWPEGEWAFTHLARARDGLDFDIKTNELLVDYARSMAMGDMLRRFRSLDEIFERSEQPMNGVVLNQKEAFVLSRAEHGSLTAGDIARIAAMPESAALHIMYTLWLAGLLDRKHWQAAFPAEAVSAMLSAKLDLKKEAAMPVFASKRKEIDKPVPKVQAEKPEAAPEVEITIDEFLDRIENAATYYDMFGVETDADTADIRRIYFSLAKMFHPDKYHSQGEELRKRVQRAFTEMSQANETLKDANQRDVYDYRMRAELAARKQAAESGDSVTKSTQLLQAAETFDRGFTLLMNKEIDTALPLLARAVHYAPDNARYHAYYGKALSYDATKRHKAEGEMQAALKIDPQNPTFRLMLVEFFTDIGLKKRAEGELNRLLAVFPSNREAQEMLESLKNS